MRTTAVVLDDAGEESERRQAPKSPENGEPSTPIRPEEAGADPLDDALSVERMRILEETLLELPAQIRTCAVLRIHKGFTVQEIADTLNISAQTVKAHLFQARQQLGEKLSGYLSDYESLRRGNPESESVTPRKLDALTATPVQSTEREIKALYAEIRHLLTRPAEIPTLQEELESRILRLRSLQRQEAATMRESFESRRHLRPGTGMELLNRIEKRLNNG